jgi:O-methyltransferase
MNLSLLSPTALSDLRDLAQGAPPGNFCEVGVYKGGSAQVLYEIARQQGRRLYLFDTFTGIPISQPELGDFHQVGDFADTDIDQVHAAMPYAIVLQGIFPDTLIDMTPLAFAHVDCDQYASIKACCEVLPPMMVSGAIMVFDDYLNFEGARRAVHETLGLPHFTVNERAFWRKP